MLSWCKFAGQASLAVQPSLPRIRARSAQLRAAYSHNMASGQPAFRWRTLLELALITSVIYFFIGAPGLSGVFTSGQKDVVVAQKAQLKPSSLVYPNLDLECAEHKYDVHIFSAKPLVVYIDGFLTGEEADALVELR